MPTDDFSNQLFTGQEVGVALVPEDAGSILQVAVNRLLGGVKPKQASSIFAGQNTIMASPLGSPTAESTMVSPALTLEEWKARHQDLLVTKTTRKPKAISQSQLGLPI